MKRVTRAVLSAIILSFSACSEKKAEDATEIPAYEETLKAQDEVDELQMELEELEETNQELESLGDELDNI